MDNVHRQCRAIALSHNRSTCTYVRTYIAPNRLMLHSILYIQHRWLDWRQQHLDAIVTLDRIAGTVLALPAVINERKDKTK